MARRYPASASARRSSSPSNTARLLQLCLVRALNERRAISGLGFPDTTLFAQDQGKACVSVGIIRLRFQHMATVPLGFIDTSCLQLRASDADIGFHAMLADRQRRVKRCLGFGVPLQREPRS